MWARRSLARLGDIGRLGDEGGLEGAREAFGVVLARLLQLELDDLRVAPLHRQPNRVHRTVEVVEQRLRVRAVQAESDATDVDHSGTRARLSVDAAIPSHGRHTQSLGGMRGLLPHTAKTVFSVRSP